MTGQQMRDAIERTMAYSWERIPSGSDMNNPWRRERWAVELSSPNSEPMLIGRLWLDSEPQPYRGEPTRALLFQSRNRAREWCSQQHAKYRDRQDLCSDWRFRPVRVEEIVRRVR